MEQPQFTGWRKSTRSGSGDNCVEVGDGSDGSIGVRDSKDPDGPILVFGPQTWAAFLDDIRAGRFDS